MNNKTKFYELLSKAKYDEKSLILVIEKIMPLINSYSFNKNQIDEDLRSELIEYSISLIKSENFADKLANYKKVKKILKKRKILDFQLLFLLRSKKLKKI